MSPTAAALAPGGQKDFDATPKDLLDPNANGGITWSATGGTVDANGLYTAPSTPGTYEVRATSSLNPPLRVASVVVADDIGSYTGTYTGCEGPCDPTQRPARGLLEKDGAGGFTLYLAFGSDPVDKARCGNTGYNCTKLTGTGSGPTYSGPGTFAGEPVSITATVTGTSMTAQWSFQADVHADFVLTHDRSPA